MERPLAGGARQSSIGGRKCRNSIRGARCNWGCIGVAIPGVERGGLPPLLATRLHKGVLAPSQAGSSH